MLGGHYGSLTKEPPLATLDETIEAITPAMSYDDLRTFAVKHTHAIAPGLLKQRFLLVENGTVVYDRFLSLVDSAGVQSPLARKVMYLVLALRDRRIRRFICERVADAHGQWRVNQLQRKENADFFQQWFEPSTTIKVRSNIERFFVEAGIYHQESIHLDLDDGWLIEAIRIAAQHERDPNQRQAMVHEPAQFLIKNGWHGLANASIDQLRNLSQPPTAAADPLEDNAIHTAPFPAPAPSHTWNRSMPSSSNSEPAVTVVNAVARERATRAHYLLEQMLAKAARNRGYEPRYNENIDVYFSTASRTVLAEIKSCHHKNLHSQVRRGVSQLLEYRFLYSEILGDNVVLLLVIEVKPTHNKEWLVDYLKNLGITLAWKHGDRLVTTATIPTALRGVVLSH